MKHSIERTSYTTKQVKCVQDLYHSKEDQFYAYADKLLWWNNKINLVSRNVSRETLMLHLLHSLVISQSTVFKSADEFVDAGTGGGLPAMPLAIAYPEKKFLLNDIVGKKIIACKNIATALSLRNVMVEAGSIINVGLESQILISKHAFKINDLLEMLAPKCWKSIILLKGSDDVEIELQGVKELLTIKIFDLYEGFNDVFFKGKAMVEISRE